MLRRIDHAARSTGGASLCVDLLGIRMEGLRIALNARPKPEAKSAIIGAGKGRRCKDESENVFEKGQEIQRQRRGELLEEVSNI